MPIAYYIPNKKNLALCENKTLEFRKNIVKFRKQILKYKSLPFYAKAFFLNSQKKITAEYPVVLSYLKAELLASTNCS